MMLGSKTECIIVDCMHQHTLLRHHRCCSTTTDLESYDVLPTLHLIVALPHAGADTLALMLPSAPFGVAKAYSKPALRAMTAVPEAVS